MIFQPRSSQHTWATGDVCAVQRGVQRTPQRDGAEARRASERQNRCSGDLIGSPRGSWGAEEEESAGSITPTVVDDGRGETGGTWRGGWRRRLIQQTKAGARFSGPKPTHPLLNPPWGVNPPSDQPQTTQRSAEKKPFERMFSGRFPRAGQSNSQRTARKVGLWGGGQEPVAPPPTPTLGNPPTREVTPV